MQKLDYSKILVGRDDLIVREGDLQRLDYSKILVGWDDLQKLDDSKILVDDLIVGEGDLQKLDDSKILVDEVTCRSWITPKS